MFPGEGSGEGSNITPFGKLSAKFGKGKAGTVPSGVPAFDLGDLYTESGQTSEGSFSAVSKPNFAKKMRWKALAEIYKMHSFAPFYHELDEKSNSAV